MLRAVRVLDAIAESLAFHLVRTDCRYQGNECVHERLRQTAEYAWEGVTLTDAADRTVQLLGAEDLRIVVLRFLHKHCFLNKIKSRLEILRAQYPDLATFWSDINAIRAPQTYEQELQKELKTTRDDCAYYRDRYHDCSDELKQERKKAHTWEERDRERDRELQGTQRTIADLNIALAQERQNGEARLQTLYHVGLHMAEIQKLLGTLR